MGPRRAIIKKHAERMQSLIDLKDSELPVKEIAKDTDYINTIVGEMALFDEKKAKNQSDVSELMSLYGLVSSTPFVLVGVGRLKHPSFTFLDGFNGTATEIRLEHGQNRLIVTVGSAETRDLFLTGSSSEKNGSYHDVPVFEKIETTDGLDISVAPGQTIVLVDEAAFWSKVLPYTTKLSDGTRRFEKASLTFKVFKTI